MKNPKLLVYGIRHGLSLNWILVYVNSFIYMIFYNLQKIICFLGTHCTVVPEPPDVSNLIFLPTEDTQHLLVLSDSSSYSPYLPRTILPHGAFGTDKDFIADGFIKDVITEVPTISFRDELGYAILRVIIDVSFSSLVLESDFTVSF